MRKLVLSVSAIAVTSAMATGAAAQNSEQNNGLNGFDEIVVTAQRTESLLSDTPVAISAISGDDLLAGSITNPTNLNALVPNLSFDTTVQNAFQITIRGITSNDTTEKGDPSAAFLVDGVVIARPQAQGVSFYDIDRVEVLRGPQGTLYGRNSTAGVVHLISKRPEKEFSASLRGGYGNFNAIQATAVVNVPVNDKIALRAAVNLDQRDSYLIDAADDGFDLDPFVDNLSVRLSAAVDFTDDISLLVIGDYTDIGGVSQNGVPLSSAFGPISSPTGATPTPLNGSSEELRTAPLPQAAQSFQNNASYGITGELNWNIGPGTATYIGSYREFERDIFETLAGFFPVNTDATYEQTSHELRYSFGEDGPLLGQFGVYYFEEESDLELVLDNAFALGIPFPGIQQFGVDQNPTRAESKAVFGQLTYSVNDRLRLTGGARYTDDDKSREGIQFVTSAIDFPAGALGANPLPAGERFTLSVNDAAVSFEEFTWRVGADYDTDLGLIFATVSTGYKAGGFNDGCLIPAAGCGETEDTLFYDPENLISYEAGFKFKFLENRLRLNATAFYYDYEDLQLNTVTTNAQGAPVITILNAAEASVLGLEVDGQIQLDERNRLGFSATLLDADFENFVAATGVDVAGRALDRSPTTTFSANYTYTQPLPNGGDAAFNLRSKYTNQFTVTDFSNLTTFGQSAFTRTDVSLTYVAPDGRWNIQAYANNLEDNVNLATATTTFGGSFFGTDPRTYGVRAGVNF